MREDKMSNESPNPNMKELWQCQTLEGIKMSTEEIRKRATKFKRKIMWRNVREYVATAIAVALFVSFFINAHESLFRLASHPMLTSFAYMAYQLRHSAEAPSTPPK